MHAKHPRRRQGRGRFFRERAPPREGNQLRSSAEGFNGQPEVMNGASDLIGELFGEKGLHARTAVGVVELTLGSPIEVELVVELDGG